MTVAALAKMLDLPASSCHGLVKTLEDRGYLINLKDQGGYYFTKRLEQHALRIAGYSPLPSWVMPALEEMRDKAAETTLLARLSAGNAVYVEVLESAQSVRYIAQAGDLRPLYASAAGKALLGAVPGTNASSCCLACHCWNGLQRPSGRARRWNSKSTAASSVDGS